MNRTQIHDGRSNSSLESPLGNWLAFSAEKISAARAAGKTVFIDFTADWCITCKANEKFVLQSEAVSAAFNDSLVQTFKADWTNGDPLITKELERFGAKGVPLYVVLPPKGEAIVLPVLLTKNTVLEALRNAQAP